jgi:hypothetical protein
MSMDDVILRNSSRLSEIDLNLEQVTRQGDQIQKSLDRLHEKAIETEVEGLFSRLFTRLFRWTLMALLVVLLAGIWRMNNRLDRLAESRAQTEQP